MRPDFASSCAGSLFLLGFVAGVLPVDAPAQCSNPWLATSSTPGVLGGQTRRISAATMWDRDGAGPLPPVVVVGGDFAIAGSVVANGIAAFDPTTDVWSPLGVGVAGNVRALLPMPNGDLVAAGVFSSAGGATAINIARYDGTSWSPLGTGMPGNVVALALLPNGDLVAGGWFTVAGGVAANNIARWNGATWAPLGAGVDGDVRSLTLLPNGDLVAGGVFTSAGGIASANIARWDGTTWAPLGAGLNNSVQSLVTRSNGDLVAGGYFYSSGATYMDKLARWDGTAWSPLGSGTSGSVWALAELANGNLVAGCFQSQTSTLLWNGTSWSPMGAPGDDVGAVFAFTKLPNGDLVAGGQFQRLGGIGAGGVARWNGAGWSAMGSGLTGYVSQLLALADGSVVGIGYFAVGSSRNIARWNGSTWLPLAGGLEGLARIRLLDNGNLLAVGSIPGPGVVNNLAQWNGTSWTTYAPGLIGPNEYVTDVAVLPNGNVVACGQFYPQRLKVWNGAVWSTFATLTAASPFVPIVTSLAVCSNGDLVITGLFSSVGGVAANNIARWNGSVWAPLGSGLQVPWFGGTTALCEVTNGDVVASGSFNVAGGVAVTGIARWNGTTWSPLGTGLSQPADVLECLPNGDLVAGGNIQTAGGVTVNHIARWNGTSWSAFGTGANNRVLALAVRANGDLMVGGEFETVNGSISPFFAAVTTTCPATAVVAGAGCTGSGGPNVLTATTLPWLGSTFRARATGLPPLSFALIANGVTPIALPLPALLPQGLPGCTAWVFADLLDVALPTAGAVDTQVTVPSAPGLVGASFHQQVLPFVFDPSGNLVELTSTNALTLTLGSF